MVPVSVATLPLNHSPSLLKKTTLILMAFDDTDAGLSLKQIMDRTGLARSTAHRICSELVDLELLSKEEAVYTLGRILLGSTGQLRNFQNLRAIAEPYLFDLFASSHLGIHLAIRQGVNVRYLSRIVGAANNHASTQVWGIRPLYSTATGKAYLSFDSNRAKILETVFKKPIKKFTVHTVVKKTILNEQIRTARKIGYSSENQENILGWAAIAVPIWRNSHDLLATVSISAPIKNRKLLDSLPELIECSEQISKKINSLK
jgi:DNA-binding IclR family transcriptional regulator